MDCPRITGFTEEAKEFLDRWNDSSEYITVHTSGSTGSPKNIHLLKSDMKISAKATNDFFGINSSSQLALPLSISYIAGKMMVVRSIMADCNLHIVSPGLDPLKGLPENIRFNLIPIVPAQIPGLLSHINLQDRLENIIVGGAPTTANQEKLLSAIGVPVYATYGMTETSSHVALRKIGSDDFYTALPGIEFGVDERSCLIIRSEAASYIELVTNDCVSLISPTRFQWLGRADNVINTGGIKIYPEEIEKKLSPLIDNRAFYISSRASEKWGSEIILYVEGKDFDKEMFMAKALNYIDRKFIPKDIIAVERLERTKTGKIIRR
ncbi:MAG: AMP-binding protein [Bacteroidales bacterium]|nr:AMP-binding protein [Bacteroidales bacterium]